MSSYSHSPLELVLMAPQMNLIDGAACQKLAKESNGGLNPIQDCVATCDSLTVDASHNFDAINYTEPYLDQGETFKIKVAFCEAYFHLHV